MANQILFFNISALCVLTVLHLSFLYRRMTNGTVNRIFLMLTLAATVMTITDCILGMFGSWLPNNIMTLSIHRTLTYLYFLSRCITVPIYVLFCHAVIGTVPLFKEQRVRRLAFVLPYLIILLVLSLNPLLHEIFYFDESFRYHRGNSLWIIYVCVSMYIVYCLYLLLKFRETLGNGKMLVLMSLFFADVGAVIIQLLFPAVMLECFTLSMTLLIITMTVLRPEVNISAELGIQSGSAFYNDVRKTFTIRIPVKILLLSIKNFNSLYAYLGYEKYLLMRQKIVSGLFELIKQKQLGGQLYSLHKDTLAVLIDGADSAQVEEFAHLIIQKLRDAENFQLQNMNADVQFLLLSCPEDAGDLVQVQSFIRVFRQDMLEKERVLLVPKIEDQQRLQLLVHLEGIVNKAIQDNLFKMYYQPIYSLKQHKYISAEALIRLEDDTYGCIPPSLFIDVAEQNGTIHQIGRFVLEETMRFMAESNVMSYGLSYIEVNLSAAQCMELDFVKKMADLVRKYSLKPQQINLEITETASAYDTELFCRNIKELSEMGFLLALDDYGTGYSNIKRCLSLPLDVVKLDKSLVDDMNQEKTWTAIKDTVHTMKSIGREIVVEGIETKEGVEKFDNLGCDFIQGFYYSKPLPEKEFVQFIKTHNGF